MVIINGTTYNFLLSFPYAEFYSAEDVVNFIAISRCPCLHNPSPYLLPTFSLTSPDTTSAHPANKRVTETIFFKMENAADLRDNAPVCNTCRNERILTRRYLSERIYLAAENMQFDLWDAARLMRFQLPTIGNSKKTVHSSPHPDDHYERLLSPSSLEGWILSGSIRREDLISFCQSEKINFSFDQDPSKHNITPPTPTPPSGPEAPPITPEQSNRSANYKELAEAFMVINDEIKNLNWWRERCSNVNRNPAFKGALSTPGTKGDKKNPATFEVLLIASFLEEKKLTKTQFLRQSIQRKFPHLLDEFDIRFYPSDAD